MYDNEKDYLRGLRKILSLDLKVLDCQRGIIRRNVEKGLLPNFSHGLVDFDHSYSSIGIMGIYETMATFGYTDTDEFGNVIYKQEAYDFARKFLRPFIPLNPNLKKIKIIKLILKQFHGNLRQLNFLRQMQCSILTK